MEKELECIIRSGEYKFDFATMSSTEDDTGPRKYELFLKYEAYVPVISKKSVPEIAKRDSQVQVQSLNMEQIEDFLRKVGFIDKERKDISSANFLYLSQVSY